MAHELMRQGAGHAAERKGETDVLNRAGMAGLHDGSHKLSLLFAADVPGEQAGPHISYKSGVIALTKRRIHQGKRFRRMGKQFDARLDYGHRASGYPSIFKCLYAFAVAILPREVRFKNPH